jgi:hypothetical protein
MTIKLNKALVKRIRLLINALLKLEHHQRGLKRIPSFSQIPWKYIRYDVDSKREAALVVAIFSTFVIQSAAPALINQEMVKGYFGNNPYELAHFLSSKRMSIKERLVSVPDYDFPTQQQLACKWILLPTF